MTSNPNQPQGRRARPGKLRLNAAQWQMLEALAASGEDSRKLACGAEAGRLTSHGLVTTDHAGRACLTLLGLQRLNQGR